jgi:phosphoribosyl 1,2-cyclic phosphodiesterase
MPVYISSLNSGSNGNCYYVGNGKEAVLIDCGISCRETEKRMRNLGLDLTAVKAIFISHEHTDHIRGVEVLSRKHKIPVYITSATHTGSRLDLDPAQVRRFAADEAVMVGDLRIMPFRKYHDAADPHSFMVSCDGVNIGVFTDLGKCCDQLIRYFSQCHAAFLEANYDVDMLENGRYPYHLKRRIRGGWGHLSNSEALGLVQKHKPQHMSHLLLSHLSRENNCPDLATALFREHAGLCEVIVASRYQETGVYRIGTGTTPLREVPKAAPVLQYSLFQ